MCKWVVLGVRARLVITAASLVLAACDFHTSGGARNPVEYDMRKAALRGDDGTAVGAREMREILSLPARPMMDALNEVGVKSVDDAAVRVLVAAWEGRRTEGPNLNWADMDRSDVRFAIANELVRAHVNGVPGIPVAGIVDFGRTYLNSASDEGSLNRAIFLVVLAGERSDIERVQTLLLQTGSQTTFRAGISALASVCSPDAMRAIEQVRTDSANEVYKAIIEEVLSNSAAFRARRCKTNGP